MKLRLLIISFIFLTQVAYSQRDSILSSGSMYVMQKDMIGDTSVLTYSNNNLEVKCFMINNIIDTIYSVSENDTIKNRFKNPESLDFKNILPHINLPDWELIKRVLDMYPTPEKRDQEIKKMSYTYADLQKHRFGIYNDEIAIIKANGKYGFIDRKGKIIWELLFDNATGFVNGKAHVQMNTIWYELDKDGLLK